MLGPVRRRRTAPPEIFKKDTRARGCPRHWAVFKPRVYSAASAGGNWFFGFVV